MSVRSSFRWLVMLPLLGGCQEYFPVDGGVPPVRPATLTTTSLDGAIALQWSDEPYRDAPSRFSRYRVYSAPYNLDRDLCILPWSVEGTTVAPQFIVGALTNGSPRCFSVTAEGTNGLESGRSPVRQDTPRFEGNAVGVYARQSDDSRAGFRLWRDFNGDGFASRSELGLVLSGAADVDLTVQRDGAGRLFLTPSRAGTGITVYGNAPVASLRDIDVAPNGGYTRNGVEAVAGWGYVVEMSGPDGYKRYASLRVTSVTTSFVLLEWAFQSDPGNPELIRVKG